MSELAAGRELDALVAEKVMGWKRPEDSRFGADLLQPPGFDALLWKVPSYSTDIAAAWQVVERMRELLCRDANDYCFELEDVGYHHVLKAPAWDATFTIHDAGLYRNENPVSESAETAPLAICKAALRAVTP